MPYADPNDPRRSRRSGRYKPLTILEETGFVTLGTLTKRLNLKAKQLAYWAELGLILEAEESIKRRKNLNGRGTRFYDSLEAIKIVYMAHLINDGGLHPRIAAKYAEILKTRREPENGMHWINHNNIMMGIKHLGGLDETSVRTSRRIGQAVSR